MSNNLQQETTPLISVIMPVFNSATFLSEAIESVLGQTFRDFELLIVYDESSDESLEIIEHFQQVDSRVQLIYGEGKTLIGALNKGLNIARGQFVARMDADDISLPERFDRQVNLMESEGADICGCHFIVIGQSGLPINAKITPLSRSAFIVYLGYTVPFAHGSVIMRTAFVKKHSLKYGGVVSSEDYDLWIKFFENNAVFANVDEFLFKYRDTSTSLSKRLHGKMVADAKLLRKGFLLRNRDTFLDAVNELIIRYETLSLDERKFLLIASYVASLTLRTSIFFTVLRHHLRKVGWKIILLT